LRGLSLIDALIILAVLAVLLFAGSREFAHYGGRALPPAPTATPPPAG